MEKDPNSVEQHTAGAKLDLGKPTPLLCLTDFAPALKQLVGMHVDFLGSFESIEEACAAAIVDEVTSHRGVSTRVLLAALVAVQSHSGRVEAELMRLDSMLNIIATFSGALLSISSLTAIGARKYRPSGWKAVPDGVDRYSEACLRHFLRSFFERDDPDTGATHWCCVAWNAAAVITLLQTG